MNAPTDPGADAMARAAAMLTEPTLWKPWKASLSAMLATERELREPVQDHPWSRSILLRANRCNLPLKG
jgi:hypothetical protein